MGLNYLPSPAIIQQFFWPIMTLIICVQTYKKFGLVAKIGVGTFVCLIYIQNVKNVMFKGPIIGPCDKLATNYKIVSNMNRLYTKPTSLGDALLFHKQLFRCGTKTRVYID